MPPAPEATWSVPELHVALNAVIEAAFGETVWIAGEIREVSRPASGHRYFQLVEPGATDAAAPRLSVTLFQGYRFGVNQAIRAAGGGVRLEDGVTVRICGELRTYPARSAVQLVMTGIDPTYTLGVMQQRRDAVLAALSAEGLLGRNGLRPLPRPALRLALVTSKGSAAHADVMGEIEASGVGFEVLLLDARTQGPEAATTIVAALRTATALAVDAVLLVRGGGARSDLAAFDDEHVARAIAASPVPVLTGIGHETDRSVADEVAHTAHKTPTACASAVVEAARAAGREVDRAAASVAPAARGRLARSATPLERAGRDVAVASRVHLTRDLDRVERLTGRLAVSAPLVGERATARVDALAGIVAAHDPAAVLARGWSITRTAGGALVRSAADAPAGTELVTTLAGGTVQSTSAGGRGEHR
jgi:exodeoxyribonuclease VII large subunit